MVTGSLLGVKWAVRVVDHPSASSAEFKERVEVYICLVPKFAGLNPAEAFGFFGRKKSSASLPSKGN
jgi:hypothetical protein